MEACAGAAAGDLQRGGAGGGVSGAVLRTAAGAQLHNLYGPTEAAVDVTLLGVRAARRVGVVPIGRPIANTQLYVLDEEMQPVPAGVAGELYIGGVGLARGYLQRPELTASAFVPDPFGGPGARMYRTGDLARRASDGELEYLGRRDHQVKMRGFRIELGEIEAALRSERDVADAAVLLKESPSGEPRLVGYFVKKIQAAAGAAERVREALGARLPESMIPALLVELPALPLSVNGKVDRAALAALSEAGWRGAPEVPPRNPTEERLCAIWRVLLEVESVGIDDEFFELGGNSISSIRASAEARAAGIDVSALQILELRTVRRIAEAALVSGPSAGPPQADPEAPSPVDEALGEFGLDQATKERAAARVISRSRAQ